MTNLQEDIEITKNFLLGSKVKSFKLVYVTNEKFKGFQGKAIFEKDSINFTVDIEMNKTADCSVLSIKKNDCSIFSFGRHAALLKDYNKENVYTDKGFFIQAYDEKHLKEALKNKFDKELARLYKYTELLVNNETIKYPEAGWNISYINEVGEKKHTVTKEEAGNVRWNATKLYHDILKTDNFNEKQKVVIKESVRQGLDQKLIRSYAKPEYNSEQMLQIMFGLLNGQGLKDISVYNNPKEFTALQMEEIRMGISRMVYPEEKNYHSLSLDDVEMYARPDFSPEQMRQIRLGFEEGIAREKIKIYAKPEFSDEQMLSLRMACIRGLSTEQLKQIAHSSYSAELITKLFIDIMNKNKKAEFKNISEKFISVVSFEGDKCSLIDVADLPDEAQFELWSVLEKYKKNIFKVEETIDEYVEEMKNCGVFYDRKDKKTEREL